MDRVNRNPGQKFDGSELDWLLDEYLNAKASKVAAPTLRDYSIVLGYFRKWWNEIGPQQGFVVARNDFHKFLRWLEVQPSRQGERLGLGTVDTVMKRLKQFFHWAWSNEYFKRNYSEWIPRPTGEVAKREAPDPEKLELLFVAAGQMEKPIRNRAILAILIGTAVRRTECVNIDIEHVRFTADGKGEIAIVNGKGKKPRIVIFDSIAGDYIATHIRYMQDAGFTTGPLFLGRNGRLGAKGLYVVIKDCAARAGLSDQIQGPHDLRRLFATYWSRKQRGEGYTKPLSLQMGHTGEKMTLHYSKQDISDVRATFTSPMEMLTKK